MNDAASIAPVSVCQRCGAPLPNGHAGEWGGICPRCLIAAFAEEEKEGLELVPGFVVEEEIAHGGMGIVYRAVQRHTGRVVALKMILPHLLDSPHVRARFQSEVESVAKLDHPNVLPIYEAGENRGVPYLVMKFVSGGSLAQRSAEFLGKPRACAKLVAAAARGVQHAHERGILHRDLKPANILLGQCGEPLVSDFGLAKWLDTTSDLTRTLTVLGTPGYIAPEQGKAGNLTAAVDVYSLGAILFDLLTGRPPFLGEHALAVIQQASETPAPKLRTLTPVLDRDLETICAKCLEREPGARYCSAGDLADDLERWLAGQPIVARPVSAPARALRWMRRNPGVAIMAALLLGLGAAVGIVAWEKEVIQPPVTTGVAVLPFENLSNDRKDASFTDGLHDDVLTKLAKIADLKVISRTSVMQYRGKQNTHEIGKALHVSHVLEGSVRKTGAQFHMNAQLIDTRTDTHVWAEEYDRDLNEVFAIQSEIAQRVAEQLHVKVSSTERLAIQRAPTADLTAFDLYSRAKTILLNVSFNSNVTADFLQAISLLNQAVTRDSSFFDAYCQLAYAHDILYILGHDHTPARLALAEEAIEAAFRLRPDAGEAHLARAENLYRGYLSYDGALAELETVGKTLANDPRVFELKGYIQRREGRWEEAVQNLERAVDLDPRNVYTLQQIAITYDQLRRYSEEKSVLKRALAVEPNRVDTEALLASSEFNWKADTQPLHQLIDSVRARNPVALRQINDGWLICALAERDATAAENAMIAAGQNTPFNDEGVHFNRPFVEGIIARMTKDEGKARSALIAARAEQQKMIQAQPNYGPPVCVLGLIDAALGRREDALREGRLAVELLPVERDAINGPLMIAYSAMIAAWTGDKDLACEQLGAAIRYPSSPSYGQLKLLPFWDSLRGDPRFEEIVASLAPKGN